MSDTLSIHLPSSSATFDGQTFEPARDQFRLFAQLERVKAAMLGAGPLTLAQIAAKTGDPLTSVPSRVRDLRKPKFGGHTVERQHVKGGLWTYELIT